MKQLFKRRACIHLNRDAEGNLTGRMGWRCRLFLRDGVYILTKGNRIVGYLGPGGDLRNVYRSLCTPGPLPENLKPLRFKPIGTGKR